jgi:hypothetical protein
MDKQPTGASKNIFIGVLMYTIATVLMFVFYTIGIVWGIIKSLYNRHIGIGLNSIGGKFFIMAVVKDQTGNVVCSELFNSLLIKSDSVDRFGNEDETISSVLGKNQRSGKLSKTGVWLANTLDKIQPDHCLKSINK